jgi:rsbT co-antagonist protein RsbR
MTTPISEIDALREEVAHLRRDVAMYRSIFAQSPIGTYVYQLENRDDDRTLRMIAANPVVEQLAGLPPEAIVGKTLDENFPGLREQGLPQAFAEVVRTSEPFEAESVYSDDRVVESAFIVRAVALPNDRVAVLFENVTARHQAEHALKLANAELEQRVAERTEQLRYHQTLLHHVLDTSPSAIYVKDLHGQFLLVNRRTSALLGLTPDEMQGKRDTDLFPADFAAQWRDNEQRVIAAGKAVSIEETVMQEDGLHTFLSTRTPLYDESGAVFAIGGIAYDITERKRQEEELQMFKAVIENMTEGVALNNADTIFFYTNPAYQALTGHGTAIHGRTIFDVYQDSAETLGAAAQEAIDQGNWQGSLTIQRPDGTEVPCDVSVSTLYDDDGTPRSFLAVVRDITERKQQEEALRSSEIRQRALLDAIPDMILRIRQDHIFIDYREAQDIEAYVPPEVFLGKHVQEVLPPDVAELIMQTGTQVLRTGNRELINYQLAMPDGPHSYDAWVVASADQTYLLLIRDITEQKRQEAERESLQQQIIDAQRNALRELSTPLIPITDDVVIMPLIGTIDSQRAQQVMETLLEGVARHQAQLVLLDITGVAVVDTQVAQAFIQAAQAVRLLGAQVMLTGIQPQIAQTLVMLGADLSGIQTQCSLQAGIAAALRHT